MVKNHPPSPGDAATACATPAPAPSPASHALPTASVTFELPPGGFVDDGPPHDEIVWEDDFRQTVMDVAAGRRGVEQLRSLLRGAHGGYGTSETNLLGLSVLLEGVETRLSAAVDGMVDASNRMGFAGAFDLPGVQA